MTVTSGMPRADLAVVFAEKTVQQLVAKRCRALVVHVPRLQDPQSANKPAISTDEDREALGLLWYAPMTFCLNLGSIPLTGVLDVGVRSNPRNFHLHLAEVDGRLDVFAMRRAGR